MINNIVLSGVIVSINSDYIEILIENINEPVRVYDVNINNLNLLINNKVAIKGHIDVINNEIRIFNDNIIILDGRGKTNE